MKLLFQKYFPNDRGSISGKPTNFEHYISNIQKIHTIRKDSRGRWKEGKKIEMIMNGKIFFTSEVTKIQRIKIKKVDIHPDQIGPKSFPLVMVDGQILNYEQTFELAWNDGFKDVKSFFEYFNEPFEGKLIHWTDIENMY